MNKCNIAILLIVILTATSCNWAKDKAKTAVNKTGEIVGKTGSEFGDGIYNGVKKSFKNNIQLSDELKKEGLKLGEVSINSSDSTTGNILTTYIIFQKDFDKDITIKVFDSNHKEYGRLTQKITGKEGQARYFDFTFNKRVQIGVKGKITIE